MTSKKSTNKQDLIAAVAEHSGFPKTQAAIALEAMLESIKKALKKGDTVTLVGFGSFAVSHRPARAGRNPRTGQTIQIRASKAVRFKAGKGLKDAVA